MGQLRLNLGDGIERTARSEDLLRNRSGLNQASFRPVARVAAVEAIQGTRAFRGLFVASLMSAAFWTAVGVLILQMR